MFSSGVKSSETRLCSMTFGSCIYLTSPANGFCAQQGLFASRRKRARSLLMGVRMTRVRTAILCGEVLFPLTLEPFVSESLCGQGFQRKNPPVLLYSVASPASLLKSSGWSPCDMGSRRNRFDSAEPLHRSSNSNQDTVPGSPSRMTDRVSLASCQDGMDEADILETGTNGLREPAHCGTRDNTF